MTLWGNRPMVRFNCFVNFQEQELLAFSFFTNCRGICLPQA
jgi:hypothetical protein